MYEILRLKYYKLIIILLIDFLILLWHNHYLSISIYEIQELNNNTFNAYFANLALKIFGANYIRLAYIILHIISNILLFKISQIYLKDNAIIANIIFNLCPSALASALLINPAGIIIFIILLMTYLELKKSKITFYIVLIISVFIDKAMISFYLACIFYAYFKRWNNLFFLSFILFFVSLLINGYDFSGRPRGYFLEILTICAAAFSPPLFLYFFYTIYYTTFKGKKDLLYFCSATSFIIYLVLSFRQKPDSPEFLPFLIVSIPLIIQNFLNSYKVHLPQFRKKHKLIMWFILISLIISYIFVIFNPFFYKFIETNEHFANKYHLSKELAKELKNNQIYELSSKSTNFNTLNFYGIKQCRKNCKILKPCKKGNFKINFFFQQFNYCLKNE
ncbi:hypothetical protein [Campylobacter sp. MG1]|uniref:hypothetical protein n=1 Tax=Campylobacter sp. MG1 TaxID=2976332 RepID=UPI00226CEC27|nr:hypothetical protein [Campylobacter sp. MG1]